MKLIQGLLFAALLASCSVMTTSPEQQIRDGANTVTVTATVASTLLRVEKISKAQAASYLAVLKTAGSHLDVAFKTLSDCRAKTGSTPQSNPDPCKASLQSDINLGVSVAAEVKKALESK